MKIHRRKWLQKMNELKKKIIKNLKGRIKVIMTSHQKKIIFLKYNMKKISKDLI